MQQTNKLNGQLNNYLGEYTDNHSLPSPFYTNPDVFSMEMATVFQQRWFYAACVADIPEAGSYYSFNLYNNSVFIIKDDDGKIRAFHNTCCHRGSKLCDEGTGDLAKIVCPYHQWTYELDGRLLYAPKMGADFDPSKYRLTEIALENVGGLIFICFSDNPPDSIQEVKKIISPYLDVYKIENTKVAAQSDLVEHTNWKLVMENNRECDHCNSNHPELMVPLYDAGFGAGLDDVNSNVCDPNDEFVQLYQTKRKEWEELNLKYEPIDFPNDLWLRVARLPLAHNAVSHTTDGKLGCQKLLAPFKKPETSSLSLWTHPNSWHHFMCDHIVTFKVMPLANNQTLVRTKWLVDKDAEEGKDYDLKHLMNCWIQTNDQDRRLVERNYQGICSNAYKPGPYSPGEMFVDNFVSWYVRQIKDLNT